MIASDSCRGEATSANPAIREVKAKEPLGVSKCLRSSDGVTAALDDVEHFSLLLSFDLLHFALKLFGALFGAITSCLVSLAEEELTLLVGSLVKIDESDQD